MSLNHLLSALFLIPAAGAILVTLIPARFVRLQCLLTLLVTLLGFSISLLLWMRFDPGLSTMQFVEKIAWFQIGEVGVNFHLGIDGISLLLVILTTFLVPLACLASWSIRLRLKAFLVCLLLAEVGMVGVFLSLDLILFYVFWGGWPWFPCPCW